MQIKKTIKKYQLVLKNIICNRNNLFSIYLQHPRWARDNIKIGESTSLRDCTFVIGKGSKIEIKDNCKIVGLSVYMTGDGNSVSIGSNTCINARRENPLRLNACESASISIGDYCLFSNDIQLHTTDYHSVVIPGTQMRTNPAKDIVIGNHVWVGLRTLILKGSKIPDGCIIAAGSVISKSFTSGDSLIAGNPATIKKNNIEWNIKKI